LEIWNLVFMQFNRDSTGKMEPLPQPSVDTVAGLERVSAVMQGTYSNYDTDLFQPIIEKISKKAGKPYGENPDSDVAMRVIADHVRSATFLLADGVIPSNEGRGYVLRRILRRAIRYGKKIGQENPFIYKISSAVIESLGSWYPEVVKNRKEIEELIQEEEIRFHETLHRGLGVLEGALQTAQVKKTKLLPGETAFLLYDSYGFPLDLIEVICREKEIGIDTQGFETLMEKQRAQSGKQKGTDKELQENIFKVAEKNAQATLFIGYDRLNGEGTVLALCDDKGLEVPALVGSGFVMMDITPFYAESGGQVGDKGILTDGTTQAEVVSTTKIGKQHILHIRVQNGSIQKGKKYRQEVEPYLRKLTMRNHTATHLLHAALRKELGDRVKQAGSLVDPDRLRFDFTYPKALAPEAIKQIEEHVNQQIFNNASVSISEMPYDEAIKKGALAFFDEKYGDKVRVVCVGDEKSPFSVELCGGTHLAQIGEIGYFKIISESSVASGVRRIEALTSKRAFDYLSHREEIVSKFESKLGTKEEGALEKLEGLLAQLRNLTKENEQLRIKAATGTKINQDSSGSQSEIKGIRVVSEQVAESDPKVLRALVDQFRDRGKERTLVLLLGSHEGRASLCVGLTKDLVGRLDAGKIVQLLAPEIGGKGGGRADFAQAGGNDPSGIPNAISKLKNWLESQP
jgi:alanyl-tRNA synthetase